MDRKALLSCAALLASAIALPGAAQAAPPGVMPTRFAASEATPFAGAYTLTYYGGRVISNVKVYQVSWGPSTDPTVKSGLAAFYGAITSGPYFDWLSEYDTIGRTGALDGQQGSGQHIGHGTFGGAFTITPSNTSTTITDAQIQSELEQQIGGGKLPPPDVDAKGNVNAIYMIDFPPGMTITGPQGAGTSCAQFCAYHNTISLGGKSVPYGVLPDIGGACQGGCGMAQNNFDNATSVHSHELVEAVTDAEVGLGGQTVGRPLAWYDNASNAGEIGDICNAQQAKVGSYTVQTEWSNAKGACIAVRTDLGVCTGSNAPCRSCSANTDCSGATPSCETDPTRAKLGQCVACTSNAQCSGATPTCDKATDTCRACATSADCSQGAPVCATSGAAAGKCVQCLADSDCAGGGRCDTAATFLCAECQTDAQCKNPTPACNAQQQCVACVGDDDCTASPFGPVCASGSCVRPSSPGGGGYAADGGPAAPGYGGTYGAYQFPDTNRAACAASPGGAPLGGGVAAVAFASTVAALRRRRRR